MITRRSGRIANHAAKFDFAILKAAWRKAKGLFDKLCSRRKSRREILCKIPEETAASSGILPII
ncbi:MAG: hypothetical protein ACLTG4_02665 [Oscillospiraceae bacterium]